MQTFDKGYRGKTMYIDKWKGEFGYIDEEGCHYDDDESFISTHILGFCGCGCPEEALKYIKGILELLKDYKDPNYWSKLDNFFNNNEGLKYTMFYLLDSKGLTEHGYSVPGWLTEKGKGILGDLIEIYPNLS